MDNRRDRQAVLVVSFGTSYPETMEQNIEVLEREIGAAMPGWALRRAFTSGMIIKKLRERDGLEIDSVPAALRRLHVEGYDTVLIQPTHILNGDEYDKLRAQAEEFGESFKSLSFGAPLLTLSEDYKALAAAVMTEIPAPAEDEAVVFMGHGSEHSANSAYALFEYTLRDLGHRRAFVGTVEGYPELDEVRSRLSEHPAVRRVRLYPLMIVAGDHATNDMASEEEDSWRSRLEAAGYEVECVLRGLGEYAAVREIFVAHAQAAVGETYTFS